MKSLYDIFMAPLEKRGISRNRKRLLSNVSGKVLEIGSGTGVNVNYYNKDMLEHITFTDKKLSKHLIHKTGECCVTLELDVTNLPFEDNSFDYVVHTLVFCSVNNVEKGLEEVKRVLKKDGILIFIEHILPDKRVMSRFFKIINPFWRFVASGCNLNRDYELSLQEAGFEILEIERFMNNVFIAGRARQI